MDIKHSVKNAENFAYVGTQISQHFLRWFGEKSLEGAKIGTELGLNLTNRALRMAGWSGKKLVEAAEQNISDGPEIAHQHALETFENRLVDTKGLLETSQDAGVISEVWRLRVEATLAYKDFCINNNLAVPPQRRAIILNELMQGAAPQEQIDHVIENLEIYVPPGEVAVPEPGLEEYIGHFDPSVPLGLTLPGREDAQTFWASRTGMEEY